jgi:hypothetical protein
LNFQFLKNKLETNMNQEEINDELTKFADNLDQLLSIGNMLDSDEKLSSIQIKEKYLKRIN